MIEAAKLTIDLTPELRDHLFHVSEKEQVSPANLATEILQYWLMEEAGRPHPAEASGLLLEERRLSQSSYNPEEIVADIQRSLEALGDYLPDFSPGDPLVAEIEAIISQVEAGRAED